MQRSPHGGTTRRTLQCAVALAGFVATASVAVGQNTPLISGGLGFLHSTNQGRTTFLPTVMPVVVFPMTRHFVFETRDSFLESITPRTGKSEQTHLNRNVTYLQMDVLAGPHATLVAGKFITPFGTYNERLGPIWIGNFQDGPLSIPIGSIGSAGTGGQLRGSLFSNDKVAVDYTTFVSANVGGKQFKSSRATGGRLEAYFPTSRLEVGFSYDHMFEGAHPDAVGTHLWWQPGGGPLWIRSEYAHGNHAQAYWIEASYRLYQLKDANSFIGRFQPVFRMQQTFRNSPDSTDGIPSVDTKRVDFAVNYYLPHEARILTSYTRQLSATGNGNIWKTGIVYRFLFPAWPGKAKR